MRKIFIFLILVTSNILLTGHFAFAQYSYPYAPLDIRKTPYYDLSGKSCSREMLLTVPYGSQTPIPTLVGVTTSRQFGFNNSFYDQIELQNVENIPATDFTVQVETCSIDGKDGNNYGIAGCHFSSIFTPKSIGYSVGAVVVTYKVRDLWKQQYSTFIDCWHFLGYGSAPDLSVVSAYVKNNSVDPNDNLPIMYVGSPAQVDVAVRVNFDNLSPTQEQLNSTIQVSLKLGLQEETREVRLSDNAFDNKGVAVITIPITLTPTKEDIKVNSIVAKVNSNAINELNFENNEFSQSVHVRYKDCKVSDIAKRPVQFFPQGGGKNWAENPYAFGPRQTNPTQEQIKANYMSMVGCVTTSIAMVFDFFGIKTLTNQLSEENNPLSPLIVDPLPMNTNIGPGSLNKLFKGTSDLNNRFVATYNSQNNVDYKNAADAARASLQIECYRKAQVELSPVDFLLRSPQIRQDCYTQSLSKISYRGLYTNKEMPKERWVNDENGANYNWNDPGYLQKKKDGFKKIEELVCAGKPVLLRVARDSDANHIKGHTVVVTESFYVNKGTDEKPDYQLSFKVHDPSRDTRGNRDATLQRLAIRTKDDGEGQQYKYVIGYDVFLDQPDPAMMTVTSSDNVQFILTDYMGRKVGYDPITKTKYDEVPGAVYSYEGIAPNLEEGDIETEGNYPSSYQLFLSGDVQTGDYKLNVYGQGGGTAYITISKTDVNGSVSDTENHEFAVSMGSQKTINFKHNINAIPVLNSDLKVNFSRFETNNTKIYGELKLPDNIKINCSDSLKISIGSQSDYSQVLPLSLFNKKSLQGTIFYEYETNDYKITLSESGMYWIHIKNLDVETINRANLGKLSIGVSDHLGRMTLKLNCNNNICSGE